MPRKISKYKRISKKGVKHFTANAVQTEFDSIALMLHFREEPER